MSVLAAVLVMVTPLPDELVSAGDSVLDEEEAFVLGVALISGEAWEALSMLSQKDMPKVKPRTDGCCALEVRVSADGGCACATPSAPE